MVDAAASERESDRRHPIPRIATMSQPDDLLTSAETAALLSIKINTLECWRHKGKGPPFIKLSGAPQAPVRYLRSAVSEWLTCQTFASTSAYSLAAMANVKPSKSGTVGASA
jgi:predicted DNA-binding transcriptional regulator AlpA